MDVFVFSIETNNSQMISAREEIVAENKLGDLVAFVESSFFKEQIESFEVNHSNCFEPFLQDKTGTLEETCEMPLHYTELFHDFVRMVDGILDEYARKSGLSSKSLYNECRDAGRTYYLSCKLIHLMCGILKEKIVCSPYLQTMRIHKIQSIL